MFIAWSGPGFPELPATPGANLQAPFEALSKRWWPYDPFSIRTASLLATQVHAQPIVTVVGEGFDVPFEETTFDRSDPQVKFKEGASISTPLVYRYDGVFAREESLVDRHDTHRARPEIFGFRERTISCVPIGRTRKDPSLPYLTLSHLDVDLTDLGKAKARLLVKESLVPHVSGMRILKLKLDSRRAYPQGPADPRVVSWNVARIEDGLGRTLDFAHEGGELVIALPQPTQAGVPIETKFTLDGDLLVQPNLKSYWELGTHNWFPSPSMEGQHMTFHAVVRARKPWKTFSSGDEVRRWEEGEYNAVETRFDKPISFPVIVAGDFHTKEATRNGLTVRVSTYAQKPTRVADQMVENAFSYLTFFSNLLGAYPFREFHIIEKGGIGTDETPEVVAIDEKTINSHGVALATGDMFRRKEFFEGETVRRFLFGNSGYDSDHTTPGMMFLPREAFGINRLGETQKAVTHLLNARFSHGIAHQWWGSVVKMSSREDEWLAETFAEYCSALSRKYAVDDQEFVKQASRWVRLASETERIPIPLAFRYYHGESALRQKTQGDLIKDKGAVLLMDLHRDLGDKSFLTFLRSFQTNFKWKFASTRAVISLLNFLTKKDYTGFFDRNYWGTELPNVKAAYPGVKP